MSPQEKEKLNRIEKKLDDFLFLYNKENHSNRMEMNRTLVLKDVQNITEFDNFAGLKLGHSASKVGWFGVAPVARAGSISAPASQGGTYSQSNVQSIVTAVDAIRTALQNIGIIA